MNSLARHTHVTSVLRRPIRIALRVLVVRIQPRVHILRPIRKPVILARLDGPLAHENRKLAIARQHLRIRTQQRRDIVRVARPPEVIVVHIERNVFARVEVRRPERLAFETALQQHGDLTVYGFDVRDDGFEVLQNPGGAGVGQGGGRAKFGEVGVVGGFVDWGERVGLWGA